MAHQPANPAEPIDEERQRAYLALIDKLLLGARENVNAILTAQRELVDEGLVEMIGRYAESLRQIGKQEAAGFLEDCGQQITAFLRQLAAQAGGVPPEREQAYLDLIRQLLSCKAGDEAVILSTNDGLLDAGLFQACEQVARWLEGQDDQHVASWLRGFATTLEAIIAASNAFSPSGEQEAFLMQLLQTTAASQSDPKVVYPLLQANLALLNSELVELLNQWWEGVLARSEQAQQQALATVLVRLGICLNKFPLGRPGTNQQIAIAAYFNALRVYIEAEHPQAWADIKSYLGNAYLRFATLSTNPSEQISNAITAYEDALRIKTEQELPKDYAWTVTGLGNAYSILAPLDANPVEQIQNAVESYKNALRVLKEQEQPLQYAMINNNLGNAYRVLATLSPDKEIQIKNAYKAYENALRIFNEQDLSQESEEYATLNDNLGSIYWDLARISGDPIKQLNKAIAAYEDALKFFTEKRQPYEYAKTNSNIASVLSVLAFFSVSPNEHTKKAIASFEKALRILNEQEYPENYANTNLNLGILYASSSIGSRTPRNQIENAIDAFHNARRAYKSQNHLAGWASANHCLGAAYSSLAPFSANPREQIENAIAAFKNALRVRDPVQRPTDCLQTARNLGNLGFTNKRPDVAIDGYLLAITAVENLRSAAIDPARKAEIVSGAIEVYANLVQVYVDQQNYDQALEVVDRSKARNLVELLTSKDLYPKGEIPPAVIQRLDELRGSIARAERELNRAQSSNGLARPPMADSYGISGPEGARSQAFERIQQERAQKVGERLLQLKQELDRLIQDQIQPIDPSFSLSQKVQPLTIDQLRATLPDGQTVIVSWYVAGPQLLAFILHRDALQPICHRYPEPTLEALSAAMNAYLSAYRSENNSWQAGLATALDRFSRLLELDALLEKIQHLAPGADQLILIPHRFLHLLPLHAMPVAEAAPTPLQDHFSRGVRYAPSLQVLQVVQQRQPSPPHSLFALQNPTQDLLYSDLEVEAIQSLFAAKATVLKRSEASKAAMEQQKGALTNSACLHFACHGYFNFEQPLLSALLLAGSVLDAAPDDLDADRHLPQPNGSVIDLSECLTLLDLFQLDLRRARLVALSACETGLSDLNSLSDEVVGLSSGFLYAGCNNVIGSLWSVPDISTGLLMAQFYRLLMAQTSQGQPGNVALALKQAQHWLRTLTVAELAAQRSAIPEAIRDNFEYDLKWLKQKAADSGDNYPFRNPYYWAAFTAVGQ